MDTPINQLTISVFNKPLDECPVTELRQIAQQYPWFSAAQLAYAKKLQQGNPSMYQEQVERTSLFFPNRMWLHYLLNDYKVPEEVITEAVVMNSEVKDVPAIHSEALESKAETIEHDSMEVASVEKVDSEVPAVERVSEVVEEPSVKTMAAKPAVDVSAEHEGPASDEGPSLKIPSLKIEPLDPNKPLMTFEPYHTVDYFASQGIKMKEEERPKDRFTQQLKSFTEWLKEMKKVPVSELEKAAETVSTAEKKVEDMAARSVAERHIVTEAMAEVWIKQGNTQKAEEIYRKLSLLEPSKTAYFATKIDELKKSS